MPFIINVKHLEAGPKQYQGELELESLDMDTQDELMTPASPLRYDVTAELHDKNVLLTGELQQTFACECARCLAAFENEITLPTWSQMVSTDGADNEEGEEEVLVKLDNDCLDLTPILREDMLLTLPQHPLCAEDCQGIDNSAEKTSVFPQSMRKTEASSSAWTALDQLRLE